VKVEMEPSANCPVVLLAEDDVLVRNMVRLILEAANFRVLAAADGMEALSLSRQFPGRIDVLLTDFDMPRMNGFSLIEHIKPDRPDILLLVMSGTLTDSLQMNDVEVKLLQKPFSPEALVRTIRSLV
jgi:two-component system, cell cycle sensor histidine kinase and response regulator CckA